jgi:hypothetical protein
MSASFQPTADCDRYLLVVMPEACFQHDTDEDVTALLTVIAESTRCSRLTTSGDRSFPGGAE